MRAPVLVLGILLVVVGLLLLCTCWTGNEKEFIYNLRSALETITIGGAISIMAFFGKFTKNAFLNTLICVGLLVASIYVWKFIFVLFGACDVSVLFSASP